MPSQKLVLDTSDPCRKGIKLHRQGQKRDPRHFWDFTGSLASKLGDDFSKLFWASGLSVAELGWMCLTTFGIIVHRRISNSCNQDSDTLLRFRLHRDKTHSWPSDGLAVRVGVSCIILLMSCASRWIL